MRHGQMTMLAAIACATIMTRSAPASSVSGEASAALARAKTVLGLDRGAQAVIHYRAVVASEQPYQSDRSYPPFFSAMTVQEAWFDPLTGIERTRQATTFPGGGTPARVIGTDAKRAFDLAGDAPKLLPSDTLENRYLNPWAVIADWAAAGDARLAGLETYRDYARVVLVRTTPSGPQRLLLDPKTGFPVKLERTVAHYLWGQRKIEHVYSNWFRVGSIMAAGSSFMLADGRTEVSRTTGEVEQLAGKAALVGALPAKPARSPDELPMFLQALDLTTTAISPTTHLLANRGYAEAITRVGDEVFVFDATQGEDRVRKDAAEIARLFPGAHKITVVVTDLAWPHIAGVRAWVARGATIVTHRAGRDFLRSVIERRWTLAPDLLEQRRAAVVPELIGVDASTSLAGGAVTLHPIDGIGSEIALIAYVAADRFLWASDYLQTVVEPSAYADEVAAAVRRAGLRPERTAAQHLPVTAWSTVAALARP